MATNLDDWSVRLNAAVREFTARAGSIESLETAGATLSDVARKMNGAGAGENESAQPLIQVVGALCEINAVLLQRIGELERKSERPS